MRISFVIAFTILWSVSYAQKIFAHNDYVKPSPFYKAFELKAAYIEADVFLENGVVVVAHDRREIDPSKTLELLYLKPLSEKAGELYGVTLMIDLKEQVLGYVVKTIEKFPELTTNPNLKITISGGYPPPNDWHQYPKWIHFDGRPNVNYTEDQLGRLTLISAGFYSVSKWNGNGAIPASDLKKIKEVIDWSHNKNLPVRFWATPDFENAWEKLTELGVDIINTDHVVEATAWTKR